MGSKFVTDSGIEKGIGTLLVVVAVLGLIVMSTFGLGNLQRSAERATNSPASETVSRPSELGSTH